MKTKVLNVLLYILLATEWCFILLGSYIFHLLDGVCDHFGGGILKIVFVLIYICALTIPVIFRKKLKFNYMLPLFLILSTLLSVVLNGIIYNSVGKYVSVYSRQKWDRNDELRFYMIDDMERQFDFTGKTQQEIKDILGEPSKITKYDELEVFEYYIGSDYIDPYTYDFNFGEGRVIGSGVVQH